MCPTSIEELSRRFAMLEAGDHAPEATRMSNPPSSSTATKLFAALKVRNLAHFQMIYRAESDRLESAELNQLLIEAIDNDANIEFVHPLLADSRVNLSTVEIEKGATALHIAAEKGQLAIVNLLLAHPTVHLSIINKEGMTPLECAVLNNQLHCVERLLQDCRSPFSNLYASKERVGWTPSARLLYCYQEIQKFNEDITQTRSVNTRLLQGYPELDYITPSRTIQNIIRLNRLQADSLDKKLAEQDDEVKRERIETLKLLEPRYMHLSVPLGRRDTGANDDRYSLVHWVSQALKEADLGCEVLLIENPEQMKQALDSNLIDEAGRLSKVPGALRQLLGNQLGGVIIIDERTFTPADLVNIKEAKLSNMFVIGREKIRAKGPITFVSLADKETMNNKLYRSFRTRDSVMTEQWVQNMLKDVRSETAMHSGPVVHLGRHTGVNQEKKAVIEWLDRAIWYPYKGRGKALPALNENGRLYGKKHPVDAALDAMGDNASTIKTIVFRNAPWRHPDFQKDVLELSLAGYQIEFESGFSREWLAEKVKNKKVISSLSAIDSNHTNHVHITSANAKQMLSEAYVTEFIDGQERLVKKPGWLHSSADLPRTLIVHQDVSEHDWHLMMLNSEGFNILVEENAHVPNCYKHLVSEQFSLDDIYGDPDTLVNKVETPDIGLYIAELKNIDPSIVPIYIDASTTLDDIYGRIVLKQQSDKTQDKQLSPEQFSFKHSAVLNYLQQGRHLMLVGLEHNPKLSSDLSNLLCPPHQVLVNGKVCQFGLPGQQGKITLLNAFQISPTEYLAKETVKKVYLEALKNSKLIDENSKTDQALFERLYQYAKSDSESNVRLKWNFNRFSYVVRALKALNVTPEHISDELIENSVISPKSSDNTVEDILKAFTVHAGVLLMGPTGSGKSYSATDLPGKKYYVDVSEQGISFGDTTFNSVLKEWARDIKGGELKTLVIDEYNLVKNPHVFDKLLPILTAKPEQLNDVCIEIDGETFNLTSLHRVVFTGNPKAYLGREVCSVVEENVPSILVDYKSREWRIEKVKSILYEAIPDDDLDELNIADHNFVQEHAALLVDFHDSMISEFPDKPYSIRHLLDVALETNSSIQNALDTQRWRRTGLSIAYVKALAQESHSDYPENEALEFALATRLAEIYSLDSVRVYHHIRSLSAVASTYKRYVNLLDNEGTLEYQHALDRCGAYSDNPLASKVGNIRGKIIWGESGSGKDYIYDVMVKVFKNDIETIFDLSDLKQVKQLILGAAQQGKKILLKDPVLPSHLLESLLNDVMSVSNQIDVQDGFRLFVSINKDVLGEFTLAFEGRFTHYIKPDLSMLEQFDAIHMVCNALDLKENGLLMKQFNINEYITHHMAIVLRCKQLGIPQPNPFLHFQKFMVSLSLLEEYLESLGESGLTPTTSSAYSFTSASTGETIEQDQLLVNLANCLFNIIYGSYITRLSEGERLTGQLIEPPRKHFVEYFSAFRKLCNSLYTPSMPRPFQYGLSEELSSGLGYGAPVWKKLGSVSWHSFTSAMQQEQLSYIPTGHHDVNGRVLNYDLMPAFDKNKGELVDGIITLKQTSLDRGDTLRLMVHYGYQPKLLPSDQEKFEISKTGRKGHLYQLKAKTSYSGDISFRLEPRKDILKQRRLSRQVRHNELLPKLSKSDKQRVIDNTPEPLKKRFASYQFGIKQKIISLNEVVTLIAEELMLGSEYTQASADRYDGLEPDDIIGRGLTFLETRQGYCAEAASALTILMSAWLDLPTWVGQGFLADKPTQGESDFTIIGHAWVTYYDRANDCIRLIDPAQYFPSGIGERRVEAPIILGAKPEKEVKKRLEVKISAEDKNIQTIYQQIKQDSIKSSKEKLERSDIMPDTIEANVKVSLVQTLSQLMIIPDKVVVQENAAEVAGRVLKALEDEEIKGGDQLLCTDIQRAFKTSSHETDRMNYEETFRQQRPVYESLGKTEKKQLRTWILPHNECFFSSLTKERQRIIHTLMVEDQQLIVKSPKGHVFSSLNDILCWEEENILSRANRMFLCDQDWLLGLLSLSPNASDSVSETREPNLASNEVLMTRSLLNCFFDAEEKSRIG